MPSSKVKIPKDKSSLGMIPDQQYIDVDFYIPATDDKGHFTPVNLQLAPGYARRVGQMVESKRFPYESLTDLIRHAVKRHLEWLDQVLGQDPDTVTDLLTTMDSISGEHQLLDRTNNVLQVIFAECQELATANHWDIILDRLSTFARMIDSHPDNTRKYQLQLSFDTCLGYFYREAQRICSESVLSVDQTTSTVVVSTVVTIDQYMKMTSRPIYELEPIDSIIATATALIQ